MGCANQPIYILIFYCKLLTVDKEGEHDETVEDMAEDLRRVETREEVEEEKEKGGEDKVEDEVKNKEDAAHAEETSVQESPPSTKPSSGGQEPVVEGVLSSAVEAHPTEDSEERVSETKSSAGTKKKKEKDLQKKEKKKEKKERKEKEKKAKKSSQEGEALRRKSRGGGSRSGAKQLEAILVSHFQPHDPDGSGQMDASTFWEVGICCCAHSFLPLRDSQLSLALHPLAQVQSISELYTTSYYVRSYRGYVFR